MDIEQIKKMNEMTKTLQKHGLAFDSEDGSRIAGSMTNTKIPGNDELTKDYVELLFERNNRKFIQEIAILKEKVDILEKGIDEMRRSARKTGQERIVIRDASTGKAVEVEDQQTLSPRRNTQITKEDVKNGNDPDAFNQKDVSVENVFYYGNKK